KNHDGRIRRDELRGLNDVPAHVVMAADFGTGDRGQGTGDGLSDDRPRSNGSRLRLIRVAPELAGSSPNVVEQPGRLRLAVGGCVLNFYTNDTVAGDDFSARAKQALEMFDQNKDGYLEKSEVPESLQGQLGRFEAVDADEDGKAYPAEIE